MGRRDQQVRGTYELGRRDGEVKGTYELGRRDGVKRVRMHFSVGRTCSSFTFRVRAVGAVSTGCTDECAAFSTDGCAVDWPSRRIIVAS